MAYSATLDDEARRAVRGAGRWRHHGYIRLDGTWPRVHLRRSQAILFGPVPRLTIVDIVHDLISELRYLNARPRGGTEACRLPIHRAPLAPLAVSDELDAIIACSDLQRIVPSRRGGEAELLGVALADHLAELADERVLPPTARTGVVLAGDLYSVPAANKRGGFGDVADVWAAFAAHFA